MSAILRNAALALAAGLVCGCELIAGIGDLEEGSAPLDASPDAKDKPARVYGTADANGYDSAAPAETRPSNTADASAPREAGVDAAHHDAAATVADTNPGPDVAAASDAAAVSDDAEDATTPVDASIVDGPAPDDAPADTTLDAAIAADAEAGLSLLVDDMESTSGNPTGWLDGPSMDGTWYVFDDGSDGGVLTPPAGGAASAVIALIDGGRGTSTHAAHVSGNAGFVQFGAGMGFHMNAPTTIPGIFDASAYGGFTFYARALGTTTTNPTMTITFNVIDQETALSSSGGTCDGGATWCSGYYRKVLTLGSEWQAFTVRYSDLTRPSWAVGGPAFDAAHMVGCQFQANAGQAFDLWVDDVYFVSP